MASHSSSVTDPAFREIAWIRQQDPVRDFKVVENADGHLMCGCRRFKLPGNKLAWCEHCQEVIVSRQDAQNGGIWDTVHPRLDSVWVPISQDLHLEVEVLLLDESEQYHQREARLNMNPRLGSQFLCYLNPGEGRRTLQTMTVEMLGAVRPEELPECVGPYHPDNEIPANLRDPRSERAMADAWFLMTHALCWTCHKTSPIPDDLSLP